MEKKAIDFGKSKHYKGEYKYFIWGWSKRPKSNASQKDIKIRLKFINQWRLAKGDRLLGDCRIMYMNMSILYLFETEPFVNLAIGLGWNHDSCTF